VFEEQVTQNAASTALIFGPQRITFAKLNKQANRMARSLRAVGVGPESLVGVCLERSAEMVCALLGVLKAGGAYVPMDPAYPAERLQFMVQDAKAPVVLTQQKLRDRFSAGSAKVICIDDPEWRAQVGRLSEVNPPLLTAPSHLAYVIYTSGSTGRPKGVAVEHRSLAALLHWAKETYTPEELSGVLSVTSICFDLSVFEMFVPLSAGGKIILAERGLEWSKLSAASEVTLVNTVPSLMGEWLRAGGLPASVRIVNLAGEPLNQALVEQIYEQCPSVKQVYDLYGPTEATVYSTCAKRTRGGRATIGRPLSNEQVYLLDRSNQPVPLGAPGEVFIGGTGLARGYLNQPELTQERFVENPFVPGERLYRTGDLARYFENGDIEFLGRIDHQVKIRGFRIELGEIEAHLLRHQAVRDVLVTARNTAMGDKQLLAYVVPRDAAGFNEPELRQYLRQSLPEYMVPARFVALPAFTMTPNGKIDRKALPDPEPVRPELQPTYVEPSTDLEKVLAGIWCELLGLEKVGLHDHFFELGGHSLMITQMLARVQESLQIEVPLRAVFESPTIATLAQQVEQIMVEDISKLSEEEAQLLADGLESAMHSQCR
jgi:amino acid adenylation domain-containing protein